MAKSYKDKLLDPRWQKKRLKILERDDFKCQLCGDTETTLHIHHKKYVKGDPWDSPDIYLITHCEHCHTVTEILKNHEVVPKSILKNKIVAGFRLFIMPVITENNNSIEIWHINHDSTIDFKGYLRESDINSLKLMFTNG